MRIVRRLLAALAAALLLTAAGAGISSAQAATVTSKVDEINVILDPAETWAAQVGAGEALCANTILPALKDSITLDFTAHQCGLIIQDCAVLVEAGQWVKIVMRAYAYDCYLYIPAPS